VRKYGPIAVDFNLLPDFFIYRDGIYQANSQCKNSKIRHALLIIGYGIENGVKYWLVQNSWGTDWGLNGFAKIARGQNTCGIASKIYLPTTIIDPE
jgi:C1A family cysteine protease